MRIRHVAVAALAALTLAACGGTDGNGAAAKKGPQVAADAADALQQAGSARLHGTVSTDEQQQSVDLFVQGDDATGSVTVGGQKIQLIATGGKVYLQAPAEVWSSQGVPEAIAAGLGGKWVAVPASEGSGFDSFSISSLTDELRHPDQGATIKDDVRTDTRDGQKVVLVSASDGSTLAVAATGKPYPLQIEKKGGTDPGTLTLSEFGTKKAISAPPSPLDLSQLGG